MDIVDERIVKPTKTRWCLACLGKIAPGELCYCQKCADGGEIWTVYLCSGCWALHQSDDIPLDPWDHTFSEGIVKDGNIKHPEGHKEAIRLEYEKQRNRKE